MPAKPKSYFHPSFTCKLMCKGGTMSKCNWCYLSKDSINYCSNDLAKADHHLKIYAKKSPLPGQPIPGKRHPGSPSAQRGWSLPCRRECTYSPYQFPSLPQSCLLAAPAYFVAYFIFSPNCCLTYLFGDTAMTTDPIVKTTDATRIAGFLPNLQNSRYS